MNCITGKVGFPSKGAAEKTGQRVYRCPLCKYWHRTGPVRRLRNTVLRLLLTGALCLILTVAHAQDVGMMIFNHRVAPGMTFANVQASWGNPYRVNRSIGNGFVVEWWWYRNGLVVFVNGLVESITQ